MVFKIDGFPTNWRNLLQNGLFSLFISQILRSFSSLLLNKTNVLSLQSHFSRVLGVVGSNIACSFRTLYFWRFALVTAGLNVLGSFSAFCYKFCEQMTTGANVCRFLVYHIIDFEQKLLRKQLLYFFNLCVFYHWFCAQMTARAVVTSRVTASRSGMCGVLAFVLFCH